MLAWNVVVTTLENRYREAWKLLLPLGLLSRTGFYNVLVMQVDEAVGFFSVLEPHMADFPELNPCLSRVVPVSETFVFQNSEEFERQACQTAQGWLAELEGSRFHVRMHRRGFRGRISSQHEERFLDHYLIDLLRDRGGDAALDFDDPDYILALETVGQRAGLSLWSRQSLARHPLLKLN